MADKPIIFSAPMVRALIEGRKTQTRRVLKPQPELIDEDRVRCVEYKGQVYSGNTRVPYAPGDRLWVKEAVTWVSAWGWRYRADNDDLSEKRQQGEVGRWRSPIFMPRWASRLTLTVTDVRVQRVQDISEEDAVAEGIEPYAGIDPDCGGYRDYSSPSGGYWLHPRVSFGTLWNTLHGPTPNAAWHANPWVAAYTFTVQRGNIDGGEA